MFSSTVGASGRKVKVLANNLMKIASRIGFKKGIQIHFLVS